MNNKIKGMLSTFRNRQVVLNFYEEEALIQREGFNFNIIEVTDTQLFFYKENKLIYSINLLDYNTFTISNEFKNYIKLSIDIENWLELYFP
jgi:hypothetical protein